VLYEGALPGGQLTTTTEIENFPGYPSGISGQAMMDDIKAQALRFGADIRSGSVTAADLSQRPFKITVDENKIIETETLIIATGATAKYLGLASETKYRGQGVSACATCDGFFYKNKEVAVVGGGDVACEEATYLSGICRKVYLIVRRNVLRASKAMQERVLANPKIEILWEHTTKELLGDDDGLHGALLLHKNGVEKKIAIHGFFLAIGHHPNTGVFKKYVETDEQGYILTKGKTMHTNVSGVFAAGDVQDTSYRQAITAAASGCMAAIDAERFLTEQ
jgi:thioredoxin reductase (NADPH)